MELSAALSDPNELCNGNAGGGSNPEKKRCSTRERKVPPRPDADTHSKPKKET